MNPPIMPDNLSAKNPSAESLKMPYPLRPAISISIGAVLSSLLFCADFSPILKTACCLAIFAAVFFSAGTGNAVKFFTAFLLVAVSAFFFEEKEKANFLLPDNCGITGIVEIKDFSCVGNDIEWLGNPYYTNAILKEMKFSQSDKNIRLFNRKIALVIPHKSKIRAFYGDKFEVSGHLSRPSEALFAGDFDQRNFLLSRKTEFIFFADELIPAGHKRSISSIILKMRNHLLDRITEKISDNENKNLIAALLFGCRQGIKADTNQKLLLSGTIHIIAISGMHIAVFSFFLYLLLFWLPFRARYLISPAIIFVYVYATGMQASAVRAFLMITIWSFQKASLYPCSTLSSLFYAAAISLIINPFGIMDPGFQYSFIITGFLIAGWEKSSQIIRLIKFKNRFTAGKAPPKPAQSFFSALTTSLLLCCVAFLSGLQVSLFQQNIFNPLSVVVNLAAGPFLWPIFAGAGFSAILPGKIPADFLNGVLELFKYAAFSFSNSVWRMASPPLLIFIFTFSLPFFLIVFRRNKKYFTFVFAFLISASLTYCFWLPRINGERIYILSGGGKPPSVILCSPEYDSVNIINVPTVEHARKIIELLSSNGYSKIDTIFCQDATLNSNVGIPALLGKFICAKLIFLGTSSGYHLKAACQSAGKNGTKVSLTSPYAKSGDKDFEAKLPGQNKIIKIKKNDSGKITLKITAPSSSSEFLIQNHLNMKLTELNCAKNLD